jgi:hypothetical protein
LGKKQSIFKEFRQLYFDKRYLYDHWKTKIMFISIFNIYYLALFNYSTIKGEVFTIGILFGCAEFLGILVGEPAIHHFPDQKAMIVSTFIVMVCSVILKVPGMDQMTIYVVFLLQIFFLGLAFSLAFVILTSRTNPKLLAVAFELNFSFGCGSTMLLPILAKSPEPTPTILFLVFGCITIFMLFKIGPRKQEVKESILDKIEHTILAMIDESQEDRSSFSGFKASNMSSVILDNKYIKNKLHSKWKKKESSANKRNEHQDSDSD